MNCVNFDYSKMKGKIRELNLTQSDFAKMLNISEQTLNLRFKNKRPFTQPEIMKSMEIFEEPIENAKYYFFTEKVTKNVTKN